MAEEEMPTFLISRFVLEARRWRCYFIGSGQSTDAEILRTRVTENLSSRMVFYTSDRRARMAGLEQEVVKNLLPALKHAAPGVMIFDCSRWDEPLLGAIPHITAADVQRFLATLPRYAEDHQSWPSAPIRWSQAMEALQPNRRLAQPAETISFPGNAQARSHQAQEMADVHTPTALPSELQRVLHAWQQGHQSHRSLGAALGVDKDHAGRLIRQLKERKLID